MVKIYLKTLRVSPIVCAVAGSLWWIFWTSRRAMLKEKEYISMERHWADLMVKARQHEEHVKALLVSNEELKKQSVKQGHLSLELAQLWRELGAIKASLKNTNGVQRTQNTEE